MDQKGQANEGFYCEMASSAKKIAPKSRQKSVDPE